jgi:hypothetical protein
MNRTVCAWHGLTLLVTSREEFNALAAFVGIGLQG